MIMMSFSSTDSLKRNVDTLPAIVVNTLEKWLSKKLKEKFQIFTVFLAYKGFLENRVYFCEHYLRDEHINFENTTAFLFNNMEFERFAGQGKNYFAHLMWQEFFVAVKLRQVVEPSPDFTHTTTVLMAETYVISPTFCEFWFPRDFSRNTMLCAGAGRGNGTLYGDSVEPLLISRDDRYYAARITSYGHETCDPSVHMLVCPLIMNGSTE